MKKLLGRCFALVFLPLLFTSLLIVPSSQPAFAASGGRIGGGSFRAPSVPRSGGYRGGGSYRGYGGYGGGGYRGSGIGFPFILPIFGFGGGGLFGFLILMTIAGVIVNSLRGISGQTFTNSTNTVIEKAQGPVTMVQLQIGLLAKAKDLQKDLREIASSADTSTSKGLQRVLQETTLSLLRQPDLWVYANTETGSVPFSSAEMTFNRLSLTERSKLKAELTSNVSGQILPVTSSKSNPGEADSANEYIAITLLIALRNRININQLNTSQKLEESLRILGSQSSNDLIALEVIWQPEGQGEVLSAEELVTAYPHLRHL